MYISPAEYLDLTDRIAFFKAKYEEGEKEMSQIRQTNAKQAETIRILNLRLQEHEKKSKEKQKQITDHITTSSVNVINHVTMTAEDQKTFIELQINRLKNDPLVEKIKNLEKEGRRKNSQVIEFYEKVRNLFHVATKKKNQPTAADLFKWVSSEKKNQLNQDSFAGKKTALEEKAKRPAKQRNISKDSEKQNSVGSLLDSFSSRLPEKHKDREKVNAKSKIAERDPSQFV